MLILGGRGSRPLSKRRVSIPTIRQVENKNKFGGDVAEKGRVFKRDTLKGDGQCVIRLSTAPFYICTWVSRVNAQSSLRLLLNSFPFLEFYRMFKIKNCAFLEQYSLNGGFLENNCFFLCYYYIYVGFSEYFPLTGIPKDGLSFPTTSWVGGFYPYALILKSVSPPPPASGLSD